MALDLSLKTRSRASSQSTTPSPPPASPSVEHMDDHRTQDLPLNYCKKDALRAVESLRRYKLAKTQCLTYMQRVRQILASTSSKYSSSASAGASTSTSPGVGSPTPPDTSIRTSATGYTTGGCNNSVRFNPMKRRTLTSADSDEENKPPKRPSLDHTDVRNPGLTHRTQLTRADTWPIGRATRCHVVRATSPDHQGDDDVFVTLPDDPRDWSRDDVHAWLHTMMVTHKLPEIQLNRFLMNGKALCLMSIAMFMQRVPLGGKTLYRDFQLRLSRAMSAAT